MQQSHTFDNYFGMYPGADGLSANTCIPTDADPATPECVEPYNIGRGTTANLRQSPEVFWSQYNQGRMNGFVRTLNRRNQDGSLAMGYYGSDDMSYYWNLADQFVLFDRFFSSAHAGSIQNRMFWVAGQAGSEEGRIPENGFGDVPTIFDRLEAQGISWKFYINNYDPQRNYRTMKDSLVLYPQVQWVPLLGFDRFIDDPKLASHIVDLDEFYDDLRNGTLPAVSYMLGLGATEQPPAYPEKGQRFVRKILQPLIQSEAWSSSAFLLTYDDWGGWYDHVPPPQVDAYGYGFRVPALLVSAYAKRGFVDSTTLDFTSILKFIEENYGLEPLASRDAQANSLMNAFDFSRPPRPAEFISFARSGGEIEAGTRRSVIYLTYTAAFVVALAVMLVAVLYTGMAASRRRTGVAE